MLNKKKYWIKFDVYTCVMCGRDKIYRERKYTKKPKNRDARYSVNQDCCYSCQKDIYGFDSREVYVLD